MMGSTPGKGLMLIMNKSYSRTLDCTRSLVFLSALFVAAAPGAFGQTHAGQSGASSQATLAETRVPMFDVVSIKPNKSGSGNNNSTSFSGESFSATNISVKMLLEDAYDVKQDLISGLPGWASSDRFDIHAKVVEPDLELLKKLTPKQAEGMLQAILVDRFQLKVHTETKTLPVYEMVVVKDGPKFKASAPEGSPEDKSPNDVARGAMTVQSTVQNTELTGHAIPLASFANMLTDQLHRTVIDKTGLTGQYDLLLKWTSDDTSDASSDSSTPSIFTALQEQLGLKLQSSKGPVDTLVVDRVEMPSEN
ncbi:MAG TPA: TIGR03435 family protein [Granulicella sp.]|jgi:uncharacterized protein (TIGR03435 family)